MMKILMYTSLLLTTFTLQAQDFKETTDVVDAQAKITRGLINNVMDEIETEEVEMGFEVDDYYDQVQQFKNEANDVMINFEEQMQEQVFNPARKLISEYNSVFNSRVFSSIQKSEILRELKQNMDEKFTALSVKYQSLIEKLYSFGGLDLNKDFYRLELSKKYDEIKTTDNDYSDQKFNLEVTVQLTPKSPIRKMTLHFDRTMVFEAGLGEKIRNSILKIDGVRISHNSSLEYKSAFNRKCKNPLLFKSYCEYKLNFEKLFSLIEGELESLKVIRVVDQFQELAQGRCESKMCKYLRVADYKKFLVNVNTKFDKEIKFKLADKKIASIKNKQMSEQERSSFDGLDEIYNIIVYNSEFKYGREYHSEYRSLADDESGETKYYLDDKFGKLLYVLTNLDK